MRVVFNGLQAGNLSGTGRYVAALAEHLAAQTDIDLTVLWPKHLPVPDWHVSFIPVSARAPVCRLWHDQVTARNHGFDVIHYPATVGPLLSTPNAVITIHDLDFMRDTAWHRRSRTSYYTFAMRRSASLARRIIADSTATADDVHRMLGVPVDLIDVIPLGVGEEFQPASQEAQTAVRPRYSLPRTFFLFVGTLEPRKNLVRLIHAYSKIADRCPQDLVIAGRDGWKFGDIYAAAAAADCSQRIHFPGYIADADLPAVMSAAQAFVWPSLWEGFGLPPLDAMACGTPVISSNTSSMPEVLGDGAVYFEPCDTDALAQALIEVASNESLREDMRRKGQAQATQFTWERTARATVDSYRKAMT